MTHYGARDAPQMLHLLLTGAVTARHPVALLWFDGDTARAETVAVHRLTTDALGVVTGAWLRLPDGLVKCVDLWEIIDAVLLDESEAC